MARQTCHGSETLPQESDSIARLESALNSRRKPASAYVTYVYVVV
jgi:hypothetical protein